MTQAMTPYLDTFVARMNAKLDERAFYRFGYVFGKKYAKIVLEYSSGGQSVWGFVVNTTTDSKFDYGAILKPAGWQGPARNFSRGNIFSDSVEKFSQYGL